MGPTGKAGTGEHGISSQLFMIYMSDGIKDGIVAFKKEPFTIRVILR